MQAIHVHRYSTASDVPEGSVPVTDYWQGWIEPDDLSWILFIDVDGRVTMFDERDPVTGGVR